MGCRGWGGAVRCGAVRCGVCVNSYFRPVQKYSYLGSITCWEDLVIPLFSVPQK